MTKDLEGHHEGSDPWSDWDLLECPDFLGFRKRVDDLECGAGGAATGPSAHPLNKEVADILERIADLEGDRPGGYIGWGI